VRPAPEQRGPLVFWLVVSLSQRRRPPHAKELRRVGPGAVCTPQTWKAGDVSVRRTIVKETPQPAGGASETGAGPPRWRLLKSQRRWSPLAWEGVWGPLAL